MSETLPDARGRFGAYGGAFVPEILAPAFDALRAAWDEAQADPAFWAGWRHILRDYVGRPTPLTFAPRLSGRPGGEGSIEGGGWSAEGPDLISCHPELASG